MINLDWIIRRVLRLPPVPQEILLTPNFETVAAQIQAIPEEAARVAAVDRTIHINLDQAVETSAGGGRWPTLAE
ncbi:MAG: hypothetical protein FJW39_31200 [Acidobacteria bacterium]|nr:hypothetical protein [Acidobacteriota bacterium]